MTSNLTSQLPDYNTLAGSWESPEIEPAPEGASGFITRAFDFDQHAWRVRFSAWADAARKIHLFDGVAEGTFELEGPWESVPGARAAVFQFSRRLFTVHNRSLAELLTKNRSGVAVWAPGLQQDVSSTGALFFPSLAASSVEYDLLAFDSAIGNDLYLGDRSHPMSRPELRPNRRIAFPVRKVS